MTVILLGLPPLFANGPGWPPAGGTPLESPLKVWTGAEWVPLVGPPAP